MPKKNMTCDKNHTWEIEASSNNWNCPTCKGKGKEVSLDKKVAEKKPTDKKVDWSKTLDDMVLDETHQPKHWSTAKGGVARFSMERAEMETLLKAAMLEVLKALNPDMNKVGGHDHVLVVEDAKGKTVDIGTDPNEEKSKKGTPYIHMQYGLREGSKSYHGYPVGPNRYQQDLKKQGGVVVKLKVKGN